MSLIIPEQLLVLGAGFEEDGAPTQQTVDRATGVAHYFEEHPVDLVVFSGSHLSYAPERKPYSSEAEIMAAIAVEQGLPEDLVDLEEEATSTLTSFINSGPLLRPEQSVGVVTHNYHMARALFIGRKTLEQPLVGIRVDGSNPEISSKLELVAYLGSRLVLAGIKHGDIEGVKSRNNRLQQVSGNLGPVFKRLAASNHPSFK